MTNEEIRRKAIKLINQNDEKVLFTLIQYNHKYGTKTDEEIVDIWNNNYESLNNYRNSYGEIDAEHALEILKKYSSIYRKKIADIQAEQDRLKAQK